MIVEITPPAWYPFHDDADEIVRMEVTSVGVWTFVVVNGMPTYYVSVEQADKTITIDGKVFHPWEVPSGKVEEFEDMPEQTGSREFAEEIGVDVDQTALKFLSVIMATGSASLLYYTLIDLAKLELKNPVTQDDGTLVYEPNSRVDQGEISRIALIPIGLIDSDSSLLNKYTSHKRKTGLGIRAVLQKAWVETSAVDYVRDAILNMRAQAAGS